jgi:SulP family sulfate permease
LYSPLFTALYHEKQKTNMFHYKPVLAKTLKNYSRKLLVADTMSGIIVGIVALPLAIAFAIASGVPPEKGIITAIIAGLFISVFGGSKVQIGGPTGAFIVIVYGIIEQYGISGLTVATIMAGLFLVLLGILRLGTIINYIPYPIVVGFTSGIALTIFTTQIKDLFGLSIANVPSGFIDKWIVYVQSLGTINWWALAIGVLSIVIIALTPRFAKKIPGSLVAILVMTVVAWLLKTYGGIDSIETIGDRFVISSALPPLVIPSVNLDIVRNLISPAVTIAILGAIESLLSATVADGVTGCRHDSNAELVGQGLANIVTPLFGGIPATGAIARTMTNIDNGGKTPIAGIVHAIVLLLILLFLMPLAKHIPMACLAGVLVVVAYNMSGWRTFVILLKHPKADILVLLITFLLTVFFDLTIAIQVGLIIACLLFMQRISEAVDVSVAIDEIDTKDETDMLLDTESLVIPDGVEVYEINGPYFFGAGNKFEEVMDEMGKHPKVRIIRMRRVPFVDSTGIHNLTTLCEHSLRVGAPIVLSGVLPNVKEVLEKAGFNDLVGKENICDHFDHALERAQEIISMKKKK